ncbi:MAG: CPBP family intramembrane metalloprotease [Candidatus Lindowbacteria bacterium]|nr:CPBP family intramembrane metalloprotease [Candidatus Lindowbacteria bacterium]
MDNVKLFPSFWMAILLIGACVLGEAVLGMFAATATFLAGHLLGISSKTTHLLNSLLQAPIILAVLGTVVLLHTLLAKPPLRRYLSLLPMTPRRVGAISVMVLGLAVLLSEADNLTRWVLPMPEFLARFFEQLFASPSISFVLVVLVAPLTEELVFRGIILRGLLSRHSTRTAVVLSALLFAGGHLNPYQFLSAFTLGLAAGWIFAATESLSLCMLLHGLNNFLAWFVACGFLGIEISGLTFTDYSEVALQPWWLDLGGAVTASIGIYLFSKTIRKPCVEPVEPPPSNVKTEPEGKDS